MKIGIDISAVLYGTGVSSYTADLVKSLLSIDSENEYVLFGGSLRRRFEIEAFVNSLKGNFVPKIYSLPPTLSDLLWNKLHFPNIEVFTGKLDVFHSSDWSQPPSSAFKVTTIHDLAPIKFPKITHPEIVDVHTRRLARVKREVDRIIVPSDSTKRDLLDLGYDESKIVVIPEAASELFKPASELEKLRIKNKYALNKKYLLSIGLNPRKNTKRIIEAFKNSKLADYELVIVGHPAFIEVKKESGVRTFGHVPTEDLPALYSGSEALIYPSIYEGFGLPVLEAFACGTPVVTANCSSLPEVAGDAAVLVNPESVKEITDGILNALKNRKHLIDTGRKQVKKFSWKETAKKTLEVYKSAIL